jgi:hypothetical protein
MPWNVDRIIASQIILHLRSVVTFNVTFDVLVMTQDEC